MSEHRLRLRRVYSTPATSPRVVHLSDTIQDAALAAFVEDPEIGPADVVAAMAWSLALFVVASEEDDVADDADTAVLLAAIAGLRASVETVRRVNRERAVVQ